MLSPYRVLDLTNERGMLAGQMLADLGADVIQIEPPGGSPARGLGPYYQDDEDGEKSLYWWAYARNKRGITCDTTSASGQELLRKLAAGADFLIESETPGVMASRGLEYEDLRAVNPRLVYVSISAFGQDGPKAGYADSDLIVMAAGGPLIMAGHPGQPPVRMSVPQAYHHAAAEGASGAMIAHHERQRSGEGQHVDVSAQQAVALATQSLILAAPIGETESVRASGGMALGALVVRIIWPAKDGHVSLTFLFGTAIGPFTRRLMEWIHEEGGCDEATRDKDWLGYVELVLSGKEPVAEYERVKQVVADFLATKTKAECLAEAQKRKLLMVPVSTVEEVATSPQLSARDYWREVDYDEAGITVRHPGPFVRMSNKAIQYRRRAPRLGEHNMEIYGTELGLSADAIRALQAEGAI